MTHRHVSIVAAVSLAVASPAFTQFRQIPGVQIPGVQNGGVDSRAAKDMQAVYVRDSGVATEKLGLADRMEKASQWDKSADIYQEIIEKYADRVVPTHTDAGGQPTQYTSVAMVVQGKIAKWPEAGLAAYRRRFDDVAKDQLAAAGDNSAALQKVMSLYFPTDAGKEAGIKLLTGGFERGEFALSAWTGRRLLTLHPSLAEERPAVLYVTALAEQMGGSTAAAQSHLEELKTNFPNALGTVRGVETKLADSLAAELAGQPPASESFTQGNWPMAFGAPSADAVPTDVSKGGARLFSVEIGTPPGRASQNRQYKSYLKETAGDRSIGAMTGIMPAVDNGDLFFQDNARVYAVGLSSGMPLAGWLATYPGDKRGTFSTESLPTPRGQQMAVTVTPDSVYAVLGQLDMSAINQMGISAQLPQLVSLDRATGKRNWSITLDHLKVPDSEAALHEGIFYGTPIVIGDSLFVMVRAMRGGQFDECHVVCLRAGDGTYQWSAYVASTSLGNRYAMFDNDGTMLGGATGQLSYSDGRLYVLTNLGAMACLDASDGKTLWLDIYERTTDQVDRMPRQFLRSQNSGVKPFSIDPPIVHGGQVIVMPQDSPSTFIYDAASGDLLAKVPRALDVPEIHDPPVEPADMLLGVVGPNLLMANRSTIFTLPWQHYDANKTLVANGGKFARFNSGDNNPEDGIRGRPFVTQDFVLVPTGDKLYRLSLDNAFKIRNTYPAQGKWDEQESPGNVIATPDNLIVAGPNRVTAYADLSVATAKLDDQLKASPGDVELYLRYAGLLFAAGRDEDGIAKLDAAIEKLGGRENLQHGPARDHLFEIANGFAVKLQKVDGTAAKLVTALFDRAQLAADSADQQVRVRFAMADRAHQAGDIATELALNQQVLANADWRRVTVNGGDGLFTASSQATATITQLIKENGPAIYDAYESAAAKRLAELKQMPEPDPQQLLSIADEYPVSKQTLEALSLAADRYESAHEPRQATRTLRRLLQCGLSNDRKLITLQSLARNYLAVPHEVETALVRLRQAKAIAADAKIDQPLALPDGTIIQGVTLTKALDQISAYRDKLARAQLPTFGVPATSTGQDPPKPALQPAQELVGGLAIIDQQDDLARSDRVVVWGTDLKVHVFDSKSAKEVTTFTPGDQPIGCGYSGDMLVVVTATTALASDASGKLLWKVPLSSLPSIEASNNDVTDAGNADNKDAVELPPQPPQLRAIRRINGRNIRILIGPNGRPQQIEDAGAPDTTDGPERISNYHVLSDRLIVGTTAGRLASIGLGDGKVDWQARPADRPIRHFLSNDDFLVASYTDTDGSTSVTVTDVLTGQTVSREVYDGSQPTQQLVNLALSPDGVLVAATPTQLIARDLYDPTVAPWKRPNTPMQSDMPYQRSSGPEQFVISDDKVLIVYYTGGTQQSVRAYDLRTLNPIQTHDDIHNRDIDASFSPVAQSDRQAGTDQLPVSIATAGASFYLVGPRSLAAYNLENKDSQWTPLAGEKGITRDFAICSDYAVQINQLANTSANADKVPAIQMLAYSRDVLSNGVESGNLEQRTTIQDAFIVPGQWQVSDGAFYYLTTAHKVKVMKATP